MPRTLSILGALFALTTLISSLSGCGRARQMGLLPGSPASPPAPQAAPAPPVDPEAQAVLAEDPPITLAPVMPEHGSFRVGRRWVQYIRGGSIITIRSRSREMVSDLIHHAGGMAGLNGTFFSDARVAGRGNKMIGPLLTGFDGEFAPIDPSDAPRCVGRPLVVFGAAQVAIVPYADWMGETPEAMRRLIPDARDAFLAGGWLVHNGVPETRESIQERCVADALDFRRRAFMGVDGQGRIVLGASDFSVDSARLARSLTGIDIREAVLLDSGFSTSLVWNDEILVSGHSRRDMPSRPVPHALVILSPTEGVTASTGAPSTGAAPIGASPMGGPPSGALPADAVPVPVNSPEKPS